MNDSNERVKNIRIARKALQFMNAQFDVLIRRNGEAVALDILEAYEEEMLTLVQRDEYLTCSRIAAANLIY
jgi:hypothetical protein